MNRYKQILKRISQVCCWVSMLSLFLLVALNAYEITMRFILSKSNYWIQDVSLLLMMWFLFTGVVVIVHDRQDIFVDILISALSPGWKRVCSIIVTVLCIVFNIALGYFSYSLLLTRIGRTTVTAQIPTAWYTLAILVSCVIMTLIFIRDLYDLITGKESVTTEEDTP